MKVYIVNWIGDDGGVLQAFSSKTDAEKLHRKLMSIYVKHQKIPLQDRDNRDYGQVVQVFDISEFDITISKSGILRGIELGADMVFK